MAPRTRTSCPPGAASGPSTSIQIDGNFAATAGISEMLLQNRTTAQRELRERRLLPALPPQWRSGSVKGLQARGGFELDVAWKDGRLTEAVLRSQLGNFCTVRCGGKSVTPKTRNKAAYSFDASLLTKR